MSLATKAPIASGIVEYCRQFSFLAMGNVLYVSVPPDVNHPEYQYDFTGSGSQQITFDSDIVSLK